LNFEVSTVGRELQFREDLSREAETFEVSTVGRELQFREAFSREAEE
jgi:hypothetical protein